MEVYRLAASSAWPLNHRQGVILLSDMSRRRFSLQNDLNDIFRRSGLLNPRHSCGKLIVSQGCRESQAPMQCQGFIPLCRNSRRKTEYEIRGSRRNRMLKDNPHLSFSSLHRQQRHIPRLTLAKLPVNFANHHTTTAVFNENSPHQDLFPSLDLSSGRFNLSRG